MGRTREYEGVRSRSSKSIEIDFIYKGQRCRESFKLAPSPANLKRVSQHRAAILDAIARGTFDYAVTFPESNNRFKFAANPKSAGLLLEDYLETWLHGKKKEVKASTWDGYRKIVGVLQKATSPALGRIYLPELRRTHIKEWCKAQTASNKWLRNVQSCLRTALDEAVEDELLELNPLAGWTYENADALKTEDDVDPFTTEERLAILEAFKEPQHRNLFEFAFWTGMRTSEFVALEWSDIDFIKGTARVWKAKTQCAEEAEVPKTKKSVRDVKLLPPAMDALKRQKEHTFLEGGVIFRDPRDGKPWSGDEPIRQGPWKSALKRAGVRYRRPYQTRHTYASMMLTAGEPLGWVAAQMGHTDLNMLSRIYARWIHDATPEAGNKAVELFGMAKSCDSVVTSQHESAAILSHKQKNAKR